MSLSPMERERNELHAACMALNRECAEKDRTIALLKAVANTADRWRKRKGHGPDHDCDLCNALDAARKGGAM